MKLHMLSIYWRGKRYTIFRSFPVGEKPVFTTEDLNRFYNDHGITRGDCLGFGV